MTRFGASGGGAIDIAAASDYLYTMTRVNVILNFSRTARYAFNALVGALEGQLPDADLVFKGRRHQDLLPHLQATNEDEISVVLWSFYSPQFNEIRQELATLKAQVRGDNILHFAGGVHASAEPLQTLEAGFDYVAVGEGEQIIVDFMRCLLAGESPKGVKGVAWQDGGRLRRNGRGELIDLSDYPPFSARRGLFGAMEITRGCVYACKFCQTPYVSKARFRHRSIDNIRDNALLMRSRGFGDFRFITPTALSYGSADESVNLDALQTLLATLREALGPEARIFYGTFPSEIRPEHVTVKALRMLKKYVYNTNLIIGGQSGSQAILDSSKRGHSVEAVTEAVRLCVQEGFLPNVDFLFGLPGETEDDVKKTLALAQTLTDLGAKIHNHTFMPLPGTPFRLSQAGDVPLPAQETLLKLESAGKAYGKWQTQMKLARELVQIRDEKG